MAVQAAGAAPTEDAAHDLVDEALDAAGEHTPAREALRAAGLDVAAVGREFTRVREAVVAADNERELELADGPPIQIPGWAGS